MRAFWNLRTFKVKRLTGRTVDCAVNTSAA
jgi:hypothetical protein